MDDQPALTLEALADRLAIQEVLHHYCAALDAARYDELDDVFTADADLDYTPSAPNGVRGDREAIKRWMAEVLARYPIRQHAVTNLTIDLDGDRATSHCVFYNPLGRPTADGGQRVIVVGGTYEDRFVRTPQGWRIAVRVTRQVWYRA